MKILITGGAGFIGSHLAEKLLKDGHTVFVLDDLSTGSKQNIAHLLKQSKKIIFKQGSVLDKKTVELLVRKSDAVFHLAASVGVKTVMERPLYSFVNNVDGTQNVLDAALRRRIPVLVASSSEVYGKSEHVPYREDGDRLYGSVYNARWGYALSKSADEFIALQYAREKKLSVVVVRLFNTVGLRQSSRYGMVIPTFVDSALKHKPLNAFGDGRQVRCFCHVSDVVLALSKLLFTKRAYGEVINIGSKEKVSINDLAKKIIMLTRSRSRIIHVPQKLVMEQTGDEMKIRIPDITKVQRLIRWSPKKNLRTILEEVIQSHKK